jgi:branched-chain amino acid transport system ATP-binding protein
MSLLEVHGLSGGYGRVPVLRDIELSVGEGEVVLLLGANGAGKTTTMLTLGGVLPAGGGSVTFLGRPLRGPLHRRARHGVRLVPEGRAIFAQLSTEVNLNVGGGQVDRAVELFPELRGLLDRKAGDLSGGEQQMLVMARALAADPKLLLVDELSLGLAPLVVKRLFAAVRAAADRGVGVLMVEQHARHALTYADRAYLLHRGRIALEGSATDLLDDIENIERWYLRGGAGAAASADERS